MIIIIILFTVIYHIYISKMMEILFYFSLVSNTVINMIVLKHSKYC